MPLLESKAQLLINYVKEKQIENYQSVKSTSDAWQLIIQAKDCKQLLTELFDSGILPTNKELSECNNETGLNQGKNAWFMLFEKNDIQVIKTLFEHKILPTAEALSQTAKQGPNEGANSWLLLAGSDECVEVFSDLLKHGIAPTAEALSQTAKQGSYEGINSWFWLTRSDKHIEVFDDLLKRRIVPKAKALSQTAKQGQYEGTNGWFWLAKSGKCVEVFDNLLKRGIAPTAEALSQTAKQGLDEGKNSWFGLAGSDKRLEVFSDLLKRGIVPTAEALSQTAKQGSNEGTNSWFWLTGSDKRIEVFSDLLKRGIVPTAEALSQTVVKEAEKGRNSWHRLDSNKRPDILNGLFDQDILPPIQFFSTEYVPGFIKNIHERVKSIDQLKKNFNISDNLALLITKSNTHANYANILFLLLFSKDMIKDTLFLIGNNLLPNWCSKPGTLDDIYANKNNKHYFARQIMIERLDQYSNKTFISHKDRAKSLLEAVRQTSTLDHSENNNNNNSHDNNNHSLRKLIVSQWGMFTHPGKTPYQSTETKKYQQPVSKNTKKDGFEEILKEGVKLTRR